MKKTLKKAAVLCTLAIATLCYPQASGNVSKAESIETIVKDEKSNVKKALTALSSKVTPNTNDSTRSSNEGEAADASTASYTATAYSLRGRTASGSGVRRGIIAADPRVLPIGTQVRLSAGAWSGTYLVADTGGAIKGRKIDVWVPNNSEAFKFGRRKVMLTVLSRKKR